MVCVGDVEPQLPDVMVNWHHDIHLHLVRTPATALPDDITMYKVTSPQNFACKLFRHPRCVVFANSVLWSLSLCLHDSQNALKLCMSCSR